MFMLSCVAFSRSRSGDGANARVGARCTRALTSPPRSVLIEHCIEKTKLDGDLFVEIPSHVERRF